jgi:hypothetical protein
MLQAVGAPNSKPIGFAAISRWLSGATPPDDGASISSSPRRGDSKVLHAICTFSLLAPLSGCGRVCRVPSGGVAALNHRLMAGTPLGCEDKTFAVNRVSRSPLFRFGLFSMNQNAARRCLSGRVCKVIPAYRWPLIIILPLRGNVLVAYARAEFEGHGVDSKRCEMGFASGQYQSSGGFLFDNDGDSQAVANRKIHVRNCRTEET